jgi:hypothetical protein
MHETPARVGSGAPIDLIAQEVGHCDPKKTGNDKEVSKDSDKQTRGFIAEKRGIEKRFGGKQTEDTERPNSKEFLQESKHQYVTDRQND